MALFLEKFLGQCPVGGRSQTVGFVFEDRFPVARRFSESNGARDDGAENGFAEMFLHLGNDLLGQIVAHEHSHEDSPNSEIRVRTAVANLTDDAVNFGEAFESEILALDGDEKFVGRRQGVGHENAQ